MAKGCNALGGSFRGRIGNVTCYVRHGQQIVYERIPRQEHRHVERHPGSNASMKYAQRWRKQLEDEGVVVELAPLLEFYHSIVRVADGNPGEWLVDSGRGSWSAGKAYVEDGQIRTYAKAMGNSTMFDSYLTWGVNRINGGLIPCDCWYDSHRNIYPSGSLFCSIRGSLDGELQLVIGRRNDMPGPYVRFVAFDIGNSVVSAKKNESDVYTAYYRAPLPEPYNYIYDVQGWQAPNVVGMAAVAYPFFIVNADGVVLEMAVLN